MASHEPTVDEGSGARTVAAVAADVAADAVETVTMLSEVMCASVSTLVRTAAELGEHDAVPFLSTAGRIFSALKEQLETVDDNDKHVKSVLSQVLAVEDHINILEEAQFPTDVMPTCAMVLKSLADMKNCTSNWASYSWVKKTAALSWSERQSLASKYKALFATQLQVISRPSHNHAAPPLRVDRSPPSP